MRGRITKYYKTRFFGTRFVPLIGGTRETRRSRFSEMHETRENEKPRSETIHNPFMRKNKLVSWGPVFIVKNTSPLTWTTKYSMIKESTIKVFGNRTARRCQAISKRSRLQCRNAMATGSSSVCKFHGYGGGPATAEGRARCAAAKTIHGRETRQIRANRSAKLAELHALEMLAREIGLISGPKRPGKKPKGWQFSKKTLD